MLTNDQIKKNHSNSWKTIWMIYNANQKFYKGMFFWVAILLDVIVLIFALLTRSDFYTLICKTVDLHLTILPNLLGFNLGSYALLIGLASSNFLHKFTGGLNEGFTFFQKASAVFAVSVILQAFTLSIAFTIKQIILVQELSIPGSLNIGKCLLQYVNYMFFLGINFLGIYSVLIILMLAKNIFALGQTANFFSGIEQLKAAQSEKKQQTFVEYLLSFLKR
ncbi:hypothetical protein PQ465_20690 [Sphingobacterium oryzagri]|uniref:RDD family protein n=1 Tax=Sphingobacterium oryzagri TaxID=3025669 RepID=A0ABY7WIB5_9SPHI|nr:hypothetical protein [Sphingobacterium sp. KACC 22765]WDF68700.1 hypothetical protein PQ465_20690 [Sphingobacterium sp. KACC 22765]